MTHTTNSELPLWDLTPFFPALDSPEFDRAFSETIEQIAQLQLQFDRSEIGAGSTLTSTDAAQAAFEAVIGLLDGLADRLETLTSYLYAVMTVDTRDEAPQIKLSELDRHLVDAAKLSARLTAWFGEIDIDALLERSPIARDNAYLLQRGAIEAGHLMSAAEESLAAELRPSSGNAWTRLHDNISAQIEADVEIEGEVRRLSMPEIRLLAHDANRSTRVAAFNAELAAWQANDVPIAAALNAIKGEANTLSRRRNWESPLELALFANAIDRDILDAMLAAARDFFPDARTYFSAKARLLGVDQLAWCDLFAPIPNDASPVWSYERSCAHIRDAFAAYSPRLGDLAARAFAEQWVDARPRPGKSDGAYCTPMRRDISRIFMNFTPSYTSASTLAHELGHAYHNVATGHRSGTQRTSPSTLAETASIFCETLLRQSALASAGPEEELSILEGWLQDATQTTVDITSRFFFEDRFCKRRLESDLPVSEINDLMLAAQAETYGDGLDPDARHPYMWAAKGHYYSVEEGFYNFPYMFGLLFGLGLYRQSLAEPKGFAARYDELLSSTGRADAPTLANQFGIDLRRPEFWNAGFDAIRVDIERYVVLSRSVGER